MRMHLVEMLECVGQLSQHDSAAAAVHAADVISFKRVHEALCHAVRLRAVHWRMHRPDAQLMGQSVRFDSPESAAIVAQEFHCDRPLVGAAETCFHGLNHHVAHRLTGQATSDPGTPSDNLAVAAVLHEHASHHLAVVAGDLEAIRAPALVRFFDHHFAVVRAAAVTTPRRFRQQQTLLLHHAVHALVVHWTQAHQASRTVHQGASTTVAIGRQRRDLGAYRVGNHHVGDRVEPGHSALVDPVRGSGKKVNHVRARYTKDNADRLYCPSLSNKGERAIHFFSRASSTASRRISASIVFLPSMRCSCAIWARAAANSLAGTTDSPDCTATRAPSRSSLRQLNSWLALMPCLRATSDTLMPGSYVSLTSAAFSCTDQRRRRSSDTVTTSMVWLFLVILTVLFLSVRIQHRLCLVLQGAISGTDLRRRLVLQLVSAAVRPWPWMIAAVVQRELVGADTWAAAGRRCRRHARRCPTARRCVSLVFA